MNGIAAAGPDTVRLVTAAADLAMAAAYLLAVVAAGVVLAADREGGGLPLLLLAAFALTGVVVCGAGGLELLT